MFPTDMGLPVKGDRFTMNGDFLELVTVGDFLRNPGDLKVPDGDFLSRLGGDFFFFLVASFCDLSFVASGDLVLLLPGEGTGELVLRNFGLRPHAGELDGSAISLEAFSLSSNIFC